MRKWSVTRSHLKYGTWPLAFRNRTWSYNSSTTWPTIIKFSGSISIKRSNKIYLLFLQEKRWSLISHNQKPRKKETGELFCFIIQCSPWTAIRSHNLLTYFLLYFIFRLANTGDVRRNPLSNYKLKKPFFMIRGSNCSATM